MNSAVITGIFTILGGMVGGIVAGLVSWLIQKNNLEYAERQRKQDREFEQLDKERELILNYLARLYYLGSQMGLLDSAGQTQLMVETVGSRESYDALVRVSDERMKTALDELMEALKAIFKDGDVINEEKRLRFLMKVSGVAKMAREMRCEEQGRVSSK